VENIFSTADLGCHHDDRHHADQEQQRPGDEGRRVEGPPTRSRQGREPTTLQNRQFGLIARPVRQPKGLPA
jgi:hypothetical protein